MMNETQQKELHKEYGLINARYRLSAIQTKIVLKVISLINTKEDPDFMVYGVELSFFDFLGEANTLEDIRKECKELRQKVLSIELEGEWVETGWFSSFAYKRSTQLLEVRIDPNLRPYLFQLKEKFTPREIKYVMSMESEYAIRIYELCKQNNNILRTKEFELEELRDLMQVPKSYKKQYIDFRIKVLDIAIREINKHSDMLISYTAKKHGRAVYAIEFTLSKNEANIQKECILESAIEYDPTIHKEFPVVFKKFGFEESGFEEEFQNFCLFNNDMIEKITLQNFTKWCMNKKRKKLKNKENKINNWDFTKAKENSDRLKDWFVFDICLDWQEEYYNKNITTFEYDGVHYGWQKVNHSSFENREVLLFIIDEDPYLAKNRSDVLDVEIV